MDKFFNKDSFAMRFLTALGNLILVNMLFIITCIPIITIGASLSALYRVIFSIHCKEDVAVLRTYFGTFRSSFKQSTILWIPSALALFFFLYEIYLLFFELDPKYGLFQIPVWIMIFLVLSIHIYSFPMIGLYEQPLKQTIKNSIILAITNLPVTISTIVVKGGIIFFCLAFPTPGVVVGSLYILVGFALSSFITGFFLKRIFEKYGKITPDYENEPEFMSSDTYEEDLLDEDSEECNTVHEDKTQD